MVHTMVSKDDKKVIQTVVSIFLQSQRASTRILMLRVARTMLDRYRLKRFSFSTFIIEASTPGWSTILGKQEVASRHCPNCSADIYEWPGDVRIISIREGLERDRVTYGCRCGAIFFKNEKKGVLC